ncbi:PmoA family protein [Synoicihabitans lomoniglobus]|uniref:PmoA family protein n=1 Tax=Synoicihabitans lomoniglobus TaxID=2909285 RepID=A0AAE9ZYW6_9BACT|nr:PmoA family protein [Opitutaceae bacterium LMO-M01]
MNLLVATLLSAAWRETDTSVGWVEADGPVWLYRFDRATSHPSLEPLRIPEGVNLTAASSAKGPGGIGFQWAQINGVAYPLVAGDSTSPHGTLSWRDPMIEQLPSGGFIIRQRIDYLHPSGRCDLAEYRDLVISKVGGNGKYTIDWTSHFTAGAAGATLADTPEQISGLRLALAAVSPAPEFVSGDDVFAPITDGPTLTRTQGVGTIMFPTRRHPGSVAMLADPRSTNGPQVWIAQPHVLSAALLHDGPRHLEPGEVWELSYRIAVRPKYWDRDDMQLELFRWLQH